MMLRSKIIIYQEKVLKILAGRIDGFYLAGGTALSNFYFQHRDSEDLDFFTDRFEKSEITGIVEGLSKEFRRPIKLLKQQMKKNMVKMMIFSIEFTKKDKLKVDFVEDYIKLIKPPRNINGVNVMSLEDIYLRKIYAVAGYWQREDKTGREIGQGGRQEAKDFCDLYYLSHTFIGLADFAGKYCDDVIRENLIRWYRTYNRMDIKTGLQDLKLKKRVDYRDIERHFSEGVLLNKKEVDKLLEEEVDFI
ncbi:MAG: nucleotidyl transferase AbiEii/AbiGii toxin family protein [Elusimicrobiota bacterium]